MKKRLLVLFLVLLTTCVAHAQAPTARKAFSTTAVAADSGVNLIGTGVQYHQILWVPVGTVSTCQVELDSSPDDITWSSTIISTTLCTSAGVSSVSSATATNYVRINVTTLSGGGTIRVTYIGNITTASSGGGGGSVTQGTTPWLVAGQGTAGSPGTAVLTIQGVGSGTAVPVSLASTTITGSVAVTGTFYQATQPVSLTSTTITGTVAVNNSQIGGSSVYVDPCQVNTPTSLPLNEATGSAVTIIAGVSGKKTYICGMVLVAAVATNVNLVEGTGTNCSSVSSGLFGGSTAATGINLAANGGFVAYGGGTWVAASATNADNVCYLASAGNQVSGVIKYVQQ